MSSSPVQKLELFARRIYGPASQGGMNSEVLILGEMHLYNGANQVTRAMMPELIRQNVRHVVMEYPIWFQFHLDAHRAGTISDEQLERILVPDPDPEENSSLVSRLARRILNYEEIIRDRARLVIELHRSGFQVHAVDSRDAYRDRTDIEHNHREMIQQNPNVMSMYNVVSRGWRLGLPEDLITARVIASRIPEGERALVIYGNGHMSGIAPCSPNNLNDTHGILDEGLEALGLRTTYMRVHDTLWTANKEEHLIERTLNLAMFLANPLGDRSQRSCTSSIPAAVVFAQPVRGEHVLYSREQLRQAQVTGRWVSDRPLLGPIGEQSPRHRGPDPWQAFANELRVQQETATGLRGSAMTAGGTGDEGEVTPLPSPHRQPQRPESIQNQR
jgi:hypothetical protein